MIKVRLRLPAWCRAGPDTSCVFCTNGILLRMLTQPQGLERVTHLVMDEVHERDCFADFLLIVLKQACPLLPACLSACMLGMRLCTVLCGSVRLSPAAAGAVYGCTGS